MELPRRFQNEKWSARVEGALETLGVAVLLTLSQIFLLYLLFHVEVFEKYKAFFNTFLFFFDRIYGVVIQLFQKVFGDSILSNAVFFGLFERLFFLIFLVNVAYLAYTRATGSRK
jgi:hypothetical protein